MGHDPADRERAVPPLFPEEESAHREAKESRHVQLADGGTPAREGRAVLQAEMTSSFWEVIRENADARGSGRPPRPAGGGAGRPEADRARERPEGGPLRRILLHR